MELVTELNRVLGEREETSRQKRPHGNEPQSYRPCAQEARPGADHRGGKPGFGTPLDLFEAGLAKSHTTVVIPLDDRIIVVC
jgi:hypothetical protein